VIFLMQRIHLLTKLEKNDSEIKKVNNKLKKYII
jgi:hypothetical protein